MADAVGLEKDELKLRLARAFDLAWSRYHRPGRVTVAPEVARAALAIHLVGAEKSGTSAEGALAGSGLLHLLALPLGETEK